jgi:hypothetical protein
MPPGDPTQYTMQRAFMGVVLAPPPSETQPPVIGTVSPDANEVPGSPGAFPSSFVAAKDTPIVIPVYDAENAVAFVTLIVHYGDPELVKGETIYAGRPGVDGVDGYKPGYAAHSTISGNGDPGVGYTFTLRNDAGWPGQPTLSSQINIDTKAVDNKGNVLP